MCQAGTSEINVQVTEKVRQDSVSDAYDYKDVFLKWVGTAHDNPLLVSLQLEGKPIEFHIDTGAAWSWTQFTRTSTVQLSHLLSRR